MIVAGTCDYVHLLFLSKIYELNSVTRYTDGEVCVLFFLRMLHSVDKFLLTKYVYVQMMCSLIEVSIHYVYKVLNTLTFFISKCTRVDGLGIGNSVKCPLIRDLCQRIQGSKKSALLCAVAWVSSRITMHTGQINLTQKRKMP